MAEGTWKDYKEKKNSKPLPLRGIRVLEVCTLLLGPSGPGCLSRLGAEVIKCEMPQPGPLWLLLQGAEHILHPA
jgi:hypothetical protein